MSEQAKCHKLIGVPYDWKVVANPRSDITRGYPTIERQAEAIRKWAKKVEDSLADSKSGPQVSLDVEVLREDCCSICGRVWEPYQDKDGTFCAYCGAPVEEVKT